MTLRIWKDGSEAPMVELVVPEDTELLEEILRKAHYSQFVMDPSATKIHDVVWVAVDRLTKTAHFMPIRQTNPIESLTKLYVREIVRLHGAPLSIMSDRDPRFTSQFWGTFQDVLGMKLNFGTTFHPQTVRQKVGDRPLLGSEMVQQTIEVWVAGSLAVMLAGFGSSLAELTRFNLTVIPTEVGVSMSLACGSRIPISRTLIILWFCRFSVGNATCELDRGDDGQLRDA
ncbi:uncharacterized protein LOC119983403 [Tripterygium wilfordii]|uniref:uncharacterized protein LOC119983403 n=1 Tax=Tripterygium wilfordii TaxID=458696 RepID=UPI0018F8414D|nr:uncharacterized protein LOC119983403 [Tripterygium wilfordii]